MAPTRPWRFTRPRQAKAPANGQMVACTLAPGQADTCAASLKFFLATQAQISTRISAATLSRMEDALSSFLAGQNI